MGRRRRKEKSKRVHYVDGSKRLRDLLDQLHETLKAEEAEMETYDQRRAARKLAEHGNKTAGDGARTGGFEWGRFALRSIVGIGVLASILISFTTRAEDHPYMKLAWSCSDVMLYVALLAAILDGIMPDKKCAHAAAFLWFIILGYFSYSNWYSYLFPHTLGHFVVGLSMVAMGFGEIMVLYLVVDVIRSV